MARKKSKPRKIFASLRGFMGSIYSIDRGEALNVSVRILRY